MKAFTRNIFDFCREQPVVLAGLGLALGAALAAALPRSAAQDRFLGERSDELKRHVQTLLEPYEKAKRTF